VNTDINWKWLAEAQDWYRSAGYQYIEVPWAVDQAAYYATKPGDAPDLEVSPWRSYLVASGEQGFIWRYNGGTLSHGRWMCVTPCFRHESFDDLHLPWFMKLELIHVDPREPDVALARVIEDARALFATFVDVRVVEMGPQMFDLVGDRTGIELGSYGYREHHNGMRWVYGTGIALPRMSTVRQREGALGCLPSR
jgi:hypothetical protein